MWKAIKKFIREYKELPDEGKQLLAKQSLSYLCYYYITWQKEREKKEQGAANGEMLREIAEKEFVPFVYWDVLFDLRNGQQLAAATTRFYPGDKMLFCAKDNVGKIYIGDNAALLRATEVFADTVDDLPDWCPNVKCEFGTYRTSPQWVKDCQE